MNSYEVLLDEIYSNINVVEKELFNANCSRHEAYISQYPYLYYLQSISPIKTSSIDNTQNTYH